MDVGVSPRAGPERRHTGLQSGSADGTKHSSKSPTSGAASDSLSSDSCHLFAPRTTHAATAPDRGPLFLLVGVSTILASSGNNVWL